LLFKIGEKHLGFCSRVKLWTMHQHC